ncbi:unnamed protein product [Sphagnum tenellum]
MTAGSMEVLGALDKAKTQWYHFTTIIIAGMGFFTDAYDLFCISTVTRLLGRIYYYDPATGKPGSLPPNVSSAVNGVALCGTLVGQVLFGWLGDKLGRKKVYGLHSVADDHYFNCLWAVLWQQCQICHVNIVLFQVVAWSSGIGGDYPLSATIMSEYANKKTRGAFINCCCALLGE